MVILAFDTCMNACSAALSFADGSRIVRQSERMERGHAERLIPMIAEIMDEAGLTLRQVTHIHTTIGPGTFTGTRIAIATARALALATGAKVASMTSLELLARTAAAELPAREGRDLIAAVDVRRGELYAQRFQGADLAAVTPPLLLRLDAHFDDLAGFASGDAIAVGSGAEALVQAAPGSRITPALPTIEPDARYGLAPRATHTGTLAPLYLRPPDAKPQDGKSLPRAS